MPSLKRMSVQENGVFVDDKLIFYDFSFLVIKVFNCMLNSEMQDDFLKI